MGCHNERDDELSWAAGTAQAHFKGYDWQHTLLWCFNSIYLRIVFCFVFFLCMFLNKEAEEMSPAASDAVSFKCLRRNCKAIMFIYLMCFGNLFILANPHCRQWKAMAPH